MAEISDDVVYLDLVRHLKQYIARWKSSFFDITTEEIETAVKKHERGEELTLDELMLFAEHKLAQKYKLAFKDGILSHDSIILPDAKREISANIADILALKKNICYMNHIIL